MLVSSTNRRLLKVVVAVVAFFCIQLLGFSAFSQSTTFKSGSAIIDMGAASPTVANSLKPYGLIYSLLNDSNIPVYGVIGQSKVKDGIDFTYNGKSYRGGTYIVPAEFRSTAVNAVLNSWAGQGVVIDYASTDFVVNVTYKMTFAPKWAMDKTNGSVAVAYLTAAGIPASAYSFKEPSQLQACNDIFVLPHASPTWATHKNLYFWNKEQRGAIYVSCNAVSILEGITKDTTISGTPTTIKMNFLTTNGLVNYANHGAATTPFLHLNPTDPMAQYIGKTDAAQIKGAEVVYLPALGSAWNPGTKMITQSPTQTNIPSLSPGPAAINIYGRGFDDNTRGYVMYEAAHSVGGTAADNIAAQRVFLNFSFFALQDKASSLFSASVAGIPTEMKAGVTYANFAATVNGSGNFTYQWKSSVRGTFTNATGATTSFTPDVNITSSSNCVITCVVTDACSRSIFDSKGTVVIPANPPLVVNPITKSISADCGTAPLTFNVFDSNVDPDAGVRTLTAVTGVSNGTITFTSAGSVTFTGNEYFQGLETLNYTLSNGTVSASNTIKITVGSASLAPVITNDNAAVLEDKITPISVLLNDKNNPTASSSSNLVIRDITVKPTSGYVYINGDGTLSYVTQKDAAPVNGTDSFKYLACNDLGYCAVGTVNVTITPDNCGPGNYKPTVSTSSVSNTVNITASRDSYLDENNSTSNYGGSSNSSMSLNGNSGSRRKPILYFDLTSIGSASTITSASLQLTYSSSISSSNASSSNKNPFPASIYKLSRLWTETGVTWSKTNGSTSWGSSGASNSSSDYSATDAGTFASSNWGVKSSGATATSSDITNMIQGWITNPTSNYGMVIAPASASSSYSVKFGSRDNSTSSYRPKLTVVYTTPGVSASCTTIPTTYQPIAYPDRATTASNAAVTISVLANDANFYSRSNTILSVSSPTHGGTAVISGNDIIYTPSGSYLGEETLTYTIKDAVNNTTYSSTIRIKVTRVSPVLGNDAVTTPSGTAVTVNVGTNDTDPQGALSAPEITVQPQYGTITQSGNSYFYTPSSGFVGTDTFTYKRLSASTGDCDPAIAATAVATITVTDQAPVAQNDSYSTVSCKPVKMAILTNDTDPEGTVLSPVIIANPTHGTITANGDGTYTYVSNFNYVGSDSFTYKARDASSGQLLSGLTTVTVNVGVVRVNNAPIAAPDADNTLINQVLNLDVLSNDSDPDQDNFAINITAAGLIAPSNGTITLLPNGMISYIPNANFVGTDTFEYQICDDNINCTGSASICSKGTVSVTVKAIPVVVSGKIWGDADGSAAGTFSNITTNNEVGTNAYGGVYVFLADQNNVVLDKAPVDFLGNYSLINAPSQTNNTKLLLHSQDVLEGSTLSSVSLPSTFKATSPLINPSFNIGVINIANADFGIEELPLAVSKALAQQSNPNGLLTLSTSDVQGTDVDGTVQNVKFTSFPTNTTTFELNGTSYNAGNWPVNGVTLTYPLTSIKIQAASGSVIAVIPFKVIDNAGNESASAGELSVNLYQTLTAGTISTTSTAVCGTAVPAAFSSLTDALGGRASIQYQWQSSPDNSTYTDIAGATLATYVPSSTISVTTYFRRKVSTSLDTDIYSNVITVTANALPAAPTGSNLTLVSGGGTLSANTATSGATVDWYSVSSGGTRLVAGTVSTTSYAVTGITQTTAYYAAARNLTTGCVNPTRTVIYALQGSIIPGEISANQTVCAGSNPDDLASVSDGSGAGTMAYQWQSSTDGTSFSDIVGEDTSVLPLDALSVTTYFRRKALDSGNSSSFSYSNSVIITVNPLPATPSVVVSGARTGAGTVSLNATATSGTTIDWYDSNISGNLIQSGATNLTTPVISTTTSFYAFARNITTGCISTNGAEVIATINPALEGGIVSGDQAICIGGTAATLTSATLATGGTGSISYQWQVSSNNSTFTDIALATGSTYAPGAITSSKYYRRKAVTSNDAAVYSNVLVVTVNPLPVISLTSNITITSGASVLLTASGANTYSWSPSTGLSASNTAAVTATPTSTTTYTVTGTNSTTSCFATASVTVTVNPALSAGTISAAQTICVGATPATLSSATAATGGTGTIVYEWLSSTNGTTFTTISGATSSTYSPGAISVNTYFKRGASTPNDASVYSSAILISVQQSVGGSIAGSATVCAGTNSTVLTLSGQTGSVTKWQSALASDFSGTVTDINSVANSITETNLTATKYYRAVVRVGVCAASNSSTATITVNALPVISISPSSATITSGGNVTLSASGASTYTWSPSTGLSATNTSAVVASPTVTRTYTVTGLSVSGCSSTASVTVTVNAPSSTPADTDGDGVTDAQEVIDGTDPNDGCSYVVASRTLTPSAAWGLLDCDADGNSNATDPHVDAPTASNDVVSIGNTGIVTVNVLVNDDFLPGPSTELVRQSPPNEGTAQGQVNFNALTGEMTYRRAPFESGSKTVGYRVSYKTGTSEVFSTAFVTIVACDLQDPLADCDGDGELNGTDLAPTDPCVYEPSRQVKANVSDDWKALDCDGDGVINGTELLDGTSASDACSFKAASITLAPSAAWLALDCDADGVTNQVEGTQDFDGDGIPNCLDTDSDGDGISDKLETTVDTDKDGKPDYLDLDSDNDGILDSVENKVCTGTGILCDTDADGKPNFRDLDSDADQISDVIEASGSDYNKEGIADGNIDEKGIPSSANKGLTPPDTDRDGKLDPYDVDSDGDGILDYDEEFNEDADFADCDHDGVVNRLDPDECETFAPQGISPNNDGKNDRLVFKGLLFRKLPNHLSVFNRWGTLVFEMDDYDNSWSGTILPDGTYFYVLDFYGRKPTISNYLAIDRTIK